MPGRWTRRCAGDCQRQYRLPRRTLKRALERAQIPVPPVELRFPASTSLKPLARGGPIALEIDFGGRGRLFASVARVFLFRVCQSFLARPAGNSCRSKPLVGVLSWDPCHSRPCRPPREDQTNLGLETASELDARLCSTWKGEARPARWRRSCSAFAPACIATACSTQSRGGTCSSSICSRGVPRGSLHLYLPCLDLSCPRRRARRNELGELGPRAIGGISRPSLANASAHLGSPSCGPGVPSRSCRGMRPGVLPREQALPAGSPPRQACSLSV